MVDAISFVRTDEQAMLGSTLREFLSESVDFDKVRDLSTTEDAFDEAVWGGLRDIGVIGLHIPETLGGAGMTLSETAVVFEELGRVVAAVPLLSNVVASVALMQAGTPAQLATLLPGMAGGDDIATLAVYEDAHGDPTQSSTVLSASDDGSGEGWVLNGAKRFVTDAPNASMFVVVADLDGSTALAVVRSDAEGVTVKPTPSLDATRPLGTVAFESVSVGSDDVIRDAALAVRAAIDVAATCIAAEQVGGAQRCMEISVEYAKARFQFGRAIGSFQAVKHKCADMLVAVEHARSVAWHAASTIEDPDESAIAVPLARSVCSDAFIKVAGDTIQVLGGIGFTWEHEAHLYFKRAKSTSLLFGSVDTYRDRLADAVGI